MVVKDLRQRISSNNAIAFRANSDLAESHLAMYKTQTTETVNLALG